MVKFKRLFIRSDTHRKIKRKAAENGLPMIDLIDDLVPDNEDIKKNEKKFMRFSF